MTYLSFRLVWWGCWSLSQLNGQGRGIMVNFQLINGEYGHLRVQCGVLTPLPTTRYLVNILAPPSPNK